jgi:hypothetical protein
MSAQGRACPQPAGGRASSAGVRRDTGSRGVPDQGCGPQEFERPQDALLTVRAALDVDPGQAQHERPHRLEWSGGRRRLRQQGPTPRERDRPAPVGEQAEVADADKAVGDHVEQEATEELLGVELHDLHAVPVGVVAPPEADAALGQGDEAVVGDRHPMRVAAEVGEHMLGPGEGRLAVDDPGLPAQLGEPRGERGALGQGGQAPGDVQPKARCRPARYRPRKTLANARTGKRKSGRAGIQRLPSGASAPPVTTQWTCTC